jgi:hypothetical protein
MKVVNFYLDKIEGIQNIPTVLVYDAGCILKNFIDSNGLKKKSKRAAILNETIVRPISFQKP